MPAAVGVVDRRSVAEMGGEFLREGAVLVSVFSPLDLAVLNQPLTSGFVGVTLGLAAVLLIAGMAVERWRKS